jgi:hypothetical protein
LIENAGSDFVAMPSLTLMTMFAYDPTWDEDGVPLKVPVELLNVAQPGFLAILYVSLLPSGSDAVGRKEYVLPT